MAKRFRGAAAAFAVALMVALAAVTARAQSCPGGDALTGFRLMVAPPGGGPMLPLTQVNILEPGDMLWYLPSHLPVRWRNSGRVAVLLIPSAEDAANVTVLAARKAELPAAWAVPAPAAAVALLFGPKGFDAGTIRKLAEAHPEMIRNFIDYASQATRVEALVALLARYEESAPGSMDLNAMLHRYAERYGVTLPKVNPALPPEETASELLRAVAPPTAQEDGTTAHAALAADSQSAAAAVASLYFAPVVGAMGVASSSVPLVKALHGMMFPGTAFRGAFAVPDGGAGTPPGDMALCTTNAAPQPHKRLAYLWMTRISGDPAPAMRLLSDPRVTAGWRAKFPVTCDSVAQLRALMRARDWSLTSGGRRYPVPVEVSVGTQSDNVQLDLRNAPVPPGRYQLSARWDWTEMTAQGAIQVRPAPALGGARLAAGSPPLISGGGTVTLRLTGADFSLVHGARLVNGKGKTRMGKVPVLVLPGGGGLEIHLDTHLLAPGAYRLRIEAANGQTGQVALTVLTPDPVLSGLPVMVHLGQKRVVLRLEGEHLDEIERIASPGAAWTMGAAEDGGRRRAAALVASGNWTAGQMVAAKISVAGRSDPILIPDAIRVAPPLPAIQAVTEAPFDGPIALEPGELPAEAMVSFAVEVRHAGDEPAFLLGCPDSEASRARLRLQIGASGGDGAQLEPAGQGLYYLAFRPGKIGRSGCQLELTVLAPGVGDSAERPLGRIVHLPRIERFTLSDDSDTPGRYEGTLTGINLQLIAATGWNRRDGVPVTAVPMPAAGPAGTQRLRIAMPWPPPAPHAPLFIWLRGESQGRKTDTHF